jgi:opacity protein-like surface antigen
LWDAIVGFKGRNGFEGTHWSVPYYADVGTGDTELTWQAMAGLDYAFTWGNVSLVYRYLYYRQSGTKTLQNFSMHGPALGAKFTF